MLWLILAAQAEAVTLPVLKTATQQPSFVAKVNQGGTAATKVVVLVSPAGIPLRCDVVFNNGPRSNGEATCSQIRQNARYSPALDVNGSPVMGVTYIWNHWRDGFWTGNEVPDWDPVDMTLELKSMPAGIPEFATYEARLLVDASGRVEHCTVKQRTETDAFFARFLCDQIRLNKLPAAKDANGVPNRSVQPFRITIASSAFMDKFMRRRRR